MKVREAAVTILQRVDQGAYLNLTLNAFLEKEKLTRVDADFLTRLVYAVESHRLYLDYGLKQILETKKVRNYEYRVLLVAYAQMLYFDKVPDYAIINESVAMVKNKRGKQAAGFINALLHRLLENKEPSLDHLDKLEQWSIYYSHPLWLVKMFTKQYGLDQTLDILKSNQEVPLLCARVNTLKTTREELLASYPYLTAGKLAQNSVFFPSGNIAHHPLFREGKISVQDEASQAVVEYMGLKDGMKVLDMCAAPGSKTTHMASLMHNTGTIHAYDIYEHKIALIESNAKRLGCSNIVAKAYDATKLLDIEEKESFDAILLDGPCSGLGVLGRKPEIRYHDSTIMDGLLPLQAQLLKTAEKLLKKGGIMVYSTCTLNKKENQKNIEKFVADCPWMTLEKEQTIFPMTFHSDGFYMAKLVKK